MTRWEYARLESSERGINVAFTHRPAWTGIAPEAFFQTLGRMGDEGWELVAALPLTAVTAPAAVPDATVAPESRDGRDVRDPRERPQPQSVPALSMNLQVSPDRWLVFKRPQPSPEQSAGPGADMIKGLVGRRLLKGGLPLP